MDLDSAALHLGHGLRPMDKKDQERAYVRARRGFLVLFIRMAHGWREKS